MFEFQKLCNTFKKMSSEERSALINTKSIQILTRLHICQIPDVDPDATLAGFILGCVVADGKLDESEYELIYPTLIQMFGIDFDLEAIKSTFLSSSDLPSLMTEYSKQMLALLSTVDKNLRYDVITLCMCAVSIDGKITKQEKKYIKKLFMV